MIHLWGSRRPSKIQQAIAKADNSIGSISFYESNQLLGDSSAFHLQDFLPMPTSFWGKLLFGLVQEYTDLAGPGNLIASVPGEQ